MADGPAPIALADFDARAGTRRAEAAVYGNAPLAGRRIALQAALYLPAPGGAPAPVLVWLPATGRDSAQTRRLARQLTAEGFALAVPRVRRQAGEGDLAPPTRARLPALADLPLAPGAAALAGPAALAATEDAVRFLAWLAARAPALGLAGRPVLGGGGVGAAVAFNAAFLAPHLGLGRPDPGGILSYSGGFAWPTLYRPAVWPVFAIHNPFDRIVPIAPVRALSQADPALELVEAWLHAHGTLRAHPREPRPVTFGRIRDRLRAWAGA